jgi:hypothetical protein
MPAPRRSLRLGRLVWYALVLLLLGLWLDSYHHSWFAGVRRHSISTLGADLPRYSVYVTWDGVFWAQGRIAFGRCLVSRRTDLLEPDQKLGEHADFGIRSLGGPPRITVALDPAQPAAIEVGEIAIARVMTSNRLISRATRVRMPFWMLLLALGSVPVIRALTTRYRSARAQRRLWRGLCPRCEYDLRGTPQRCPECGWSQGDPSVAHTG